MEAKEVRDYIVEALKKIGTTATVELNGFNFSGADIAIEAKTDHARMYRIAVIDHKPQKHLV